MTRPRRIPVLALALVQLLLLGSASATAARRWVAAPLDGDDAYVLLVLGSDEGPPRPGTAATGHADGFHLVVLDADRTAVSILSFPRDSWVEVPGFGRTKINNSLVRGPENAAATAERLTGLEVDDWILTGFHGFIAGVDELGGLTIDVEQRLYDPRGASSDLQPGRQTLSGWQALSYARDRKSRPNGDVGRSEAHARVLQSAHEELRADVTSAADIARIVGVVRRHTQSSIPPARLFRLAAVALSIPPDRVTRTVVPGTVGTAGEASVIRLTPAADELFGQLRSTGVLELGDTLP